MVIISALIFFFCVGLSVSEPPMPDGRIIGGEITTIESFPYQVSLRYLTIHRCGGSILTKRSILTAAHCVSYDENLYYYSVQYGMNTTTSSRNVIGVSGFVRNWSYDPDNLDYDLAMVFLKEDIPFGATAQPIPLADRNPAPGTTAIVTGWGTTSEGGASSIFDLMKVEVKILSNSQCAKNYANYGDITDRMICAGVNGGGKDACQGDSGGPLAVDGVLVGVVSWGVGCGRAGFPGVYASVAEQRSWIDNTMK